FSRNQSKFESTAAHQRALLGETVTYEQDWSGRAFHSHVEPLRNADGMLTGTIGMALDITDRRRAEALLVAEKRLLEAIAKGDPLATVLDNLARAIEELAPGMICSILLLDADENILRHGAAPSLPREYIHAIDGIAIGPTAGSCG